MAPVGWVVSHPDTSDESRVPHDNREPGKEEVMLKEPVSLFHLLAVLNVEKDCGDRDKKGHMLD
jgi:hypothetical protein